MNKYYDTKGRARRVPSIEEDEAETAKLNAKKEHGRLKSAPPGAGQLAALADHFGTTLKRIK